jgi:hypothetical protein
MPNHFCQLHGNLVKNLSFNNQITLVSFLAKTKRGRKKSKKRLPTPNSNGKQNKKNTKIKKLASAPTPNESM